MSLEVFQWRIKKMSDDKIVKFTNLSAVDEKMPVNLGSTSKFG
jgi:hypothetical protein